MRSASILGGFTTSNLFPPGACGIINKRAELIDPECDADWLVGARTGSCAWFPKYRECWRLCRRVDAYERATKKNKYRTYDMIMFCMISYAILLSPIIRHAT